MSTAGARRFRRRSFAGGHPLRTKLILATLALLTATCAAIGIFSHISMSQYLTGVLDDDLQRAAGRAGFPAGPPPEDQPSSEAPVPDGLSPEGIPGAGNRSILAGQRPETFSALFTDGVVAASGWMRDDGTVQAMPEKDLAVLAGINPTDGPETIALLGGHFRVDAFPAPPGAEDAGTVLVTGISTTERDSTLASLDLTMVVLSLAGLLVTGIAGTVIIRRSLRPLDALAAVATSVSRLPLAKGEVDIPVRVPAAAAQPGSEVGTVGLALNGMIDHVTDALRARQASETKVRRFVADASHELRTPLTSIRGYTELVLFSGDVSPAGRSALERVDSESKRMSALVEDLLLLARLDEGQRGQPSSVDLTELVVEAASDAQVNAPGYHWTLTLPEDPVIVTAVESELRQVLINLLSNAHKHTPVGTRVEIGLRVEGGKTLVTVTDNGQGIDPDFMDSIFSRFSKADSARAATGAGTGSTGLGLAIVQALVAANGGSISVESRPGRTAFTVVLPLPDTV